MDWQTRSISSSRSRMSMDWRGEGSRSRSAIKGGVDPSEAHAHSLLEEFNDDGQVVEPKSEHPIPESEISTSSKLDGHPTSPPRIDAPLLSRPLMRVQPDMEQVHPGPGMNASESSRVRTDPGSVMQMLATFPQGLPSNHFHLPPDPFANNDPVAAAAYASIHGSLPSFGGLQSSWDYFQPHSNSNP